MTKDVEIKANCKTQDEVDSVICFRHMLKNSTLSEVLSEVNDGVRRDSIREKWMKFKKKIKNKR